MRLFFALLPDSDTAEILFKAAQMNIVGRARFISPENFHITLSFVGEVPDDELQCFCEMGAALCLPRSAIELNELEHWPSSQVIVLTAKSVCRDLAARTDSLRAAVALKVLPQRREVSWREHVTLARKVTQAPVLKAMSPIAWVSRSFALLRSDAKGDQAVYTVVESWQLLDEI
jgi:2'-5' RNA ligase